MLYPRSQAEAEDTVPQLLQLLDDSPDFYVEMSWDFRCVHSCPFRPVPSQLSLQPRSNSPRFPRFPCRVAHPLCISIGWTTMMAARGSPCCHVWPRVTHTEFGSGAPASGWIQPCWALRGCAGSAGVVAFSSRPPVVEVEMAGSKQPSRWCRWAPYRAPILSRWTLQPYTIGTVLHCVRAQLVGHRPHLPLHLHSAWMPMMSLFSL